MWDLYCQRCSLDGKRRNSDRHAFLLQKYIERKKYQSTDNVTVFQRAIPKTSFCRERRVKLLA
jgi:hypothetical protein